MLPTDYTRCCYTLIKQMTERRRSRKVVLLYYLDWAIYLYAVRFYYVALIAFAGYPTLPAPFDWKKDPICFFFYRNRHTYDAFVPVTFILLGTFHIIMRQLMYGLQVDRPVWWWWHQLVVLNQDLYHGSLLCQLEQAAVRRHREAETLAMMKGSVYSQLVPNLILVLIAKTYARFLVLKRFDHVNKSKFFSAKLSTLPGLSDKMRQRMLLTIMLADKVITGVLVYSNGVVLLFLHIFLLKFTEPYSAAHRPYIALVLFIEVGIIMHYYLTRLIQCALFFTACTIIASITYAGHSRELYKVSGAILNRRVKAKRQQVIHLKDFFSLTKVFVDHNKVCYLVVAGSDELFGAVLFTFLLTNVPINIFCIRNLVFLRQDTFVVAAFYFMITVQFFAMVTVFGPPAWCCAVYHAPKKWIFQLQIRLKGPPWCLFKLKYDDLMNRLLYGNKIAIYMGPNSPVTYMSAFEFIFMYSSYTMMVFSGMIKLLINTSIASKDI